MSYHFWFVRAEEGGFGLVWGDSGPNICFDLFVKRGYENKHLVGFVD